MYRIAEIFHSLQGEGANTGRAAAFVRFAGCNLRCPFCDTDFSRYQEMSADDIVSAIARYPTRFVVLTGGEPTLQADKALTAALHAQGFTIAMESNGTRLPPEGIDWLTISPKGPVAVRQADELKLLFDGQHDPDDRGIIATSRCLQPLDTGDPSRNQAITAQCIDYIKAHPQWRLSLQTHKLLGIR